MTDCGNQNLIKQVLEVVLRFLPQISGEDMPWVRLWSHAFQGPGGWYIENSLTTLGHKDPVSEENTRL